CAGAAAELLGRGAVAVERTVWAFTFVAADRRTHAAVDPRRRVVDARDRLRRLTGTSADAAAWTGRSRAARRAVVPAADAAPAAADPGVAAADRTVGVRAAWLGGRRVAGVAEALRTDRAGATRAGGRRRDRLRPG